MFKILLLFLIILGQAYADDLAQLNLPIMEGVNDLGEIQKSLSTVPLDYHEIMKKLKVKIFPHKDNRAPHRIDTVPYYVKLKSDSVMELKDQEGVVCRSQIIIFNTAEEYTRKVHCVNENKIIEVPLKVIGMNFNYSIFTDNQYPVQVIRANHDNNYFYWGKLEVKFLAKKIILVNTIDMETYLRGVVPGEIFISWPANTISSQAVAARTYALYHLIRLWGNIELYHFDDTTSYQVYIGDYIYFKRKQLQKIYWFDLSNLFKVSSVLTDLSDFLQSVKRTEGEVMLQEDGQIFQAYFHAASGGYTASANDIDFKACEPCKPVFDYGIDLIFADNFARRFLAPLEFWSRTRTKKDIEARLKKRSLISQNTKLNKILLTEDGYQEGYKTDFGHYVKIPLDISSKIKTIQGYTFKSAMGLNNIRYDLSRNSDNVYTFTGRGYGHSVGLCQWGAYFRGKQNQYYHDILKHYYKNIRIVRF